MLERLDKLYLFKEIVKFQLFEPIVILSLLRIRGRVEGLGLQGCFFVPV